MIIGDSPPPLIKWQTTHRSEVYTRKTKWGKTISPTSCIERLHQWTWKTNKHSEMDRWEADPQSRFLGFKKGSQGGPLSMQEEFVELFSREFRLDLGIFHRWDCINIMIVISINKILCWRNNQRLMDLSWF